MSRIDTVEELRRVAVHVIARARVAETGRFSLRVTPGGFGTPEFGDALRRVRVAGEHLVVEQDPPGGAAFHQAPLVGSSLADLAIVAGVDLGAPLDVGHDTPPLGDPDAPLVVDPGVLAETADWYAVVEAATTAIAAGVDADAAPTLPRLWPEHFDVAIEVDARPGRRANLGGSPGDGFSAEPYLYVGPWTDDRPGGDGYWDAPFGAARTWSALGSDLVTGAIAFFEEGLARLRD
ncbi:MAG: hypothetical protein AAGA17_04320 [Actinomycetota bacterium]